MTKIPEITIAYDRDYTHYGVMGWEDFDRHARNNLTLYHDLIKFTQYMTETDRLRVMLWHYVNEAEQAKSLYYAQARDNPPASIIGEIYRHVEP